MERALDDAIVQRGLSTSELADVVATLGRRGRPGTTLMRRLMAERGEGYVATESELEDLVRAVLERYGLPLPERQRVLGDDHPVGRVDFVYLDARLVIEADSRRHHTALLDADQDRWRDLELTAAGFRVIRVTWHQLVHEPERFVAALARPSPCRWHRMNPHRMSTAWHRRELRVQTVQFWTVYAAHSSIGARPAPATGLGTRPCPAREP